ncbi:MAG: hypothetical protein H0T53_01545 [Herpetosiphonaceae bacterium]|nr:hypothetical protein [Herpetosiphonaceae bacterium]
MNRLLKKYTAALLLMLLLTVGLATSYAQQPDGRAHHVAVVVQYGSGQVATRCVGFDEESISGYEALQRAGFGVVAEGSAGIGAMVCSIDGVGCDYPNESCGCKCEGAECIYWAYSHLTDGVWRYSTLGATAYRVRDGAVEGWAWGGGSVERGASPPVIGWDAICAAQAAAVPTAIPPTAAPPTLAPPTSIPVTLAPTRVPPTVVAATQAAPATTAATQVAPTTSATSIPPATTAPAVTAAATAPPAVTAAPATASPPPAATATPATVTPQIAGGQPLSGSPRAPTTAAPSWPSYLAFGGIAGLLGASVWLVRRRRTR